MKAIATCHPERRHMGHGLCDRCYQRWYYHEHYDKAQETTKRWKQKHPQRYKDALRKWKVKQYGLTLESFELMKQAQQNLCAICKRPQIPGKELAVDHCHRTNKVRGLLCDDCNWSIGRMKDSPELLRAAAYYLEQ